MKKEEVRNLQDEFSTLFKPQQHQPSVSRYSDSNLLSSGELSQQQGSGTFKHLPLDEGSDDFLDEIDKLIDNIPDDYQPSRREIMLNFKLNEVKLICKELKQVNQQLSKKMEDMEREQSQMQLNNSTELNQSQDLTMMQQDFTEIEQQLAKYKQELAKYHSKIDAKLAAKNEEIRKIKQEATELRHAVDAGERQQRERTKTISFLEEQNEQLLLMVEELQSTQPPPILEKTSDSYFDDRISQEMQGMIDKLMKELKYEKRNNAKQLCQIKRLNSQIIILENKLKERNNKIYQLELTAIKQNKQQQRNIPKGSTSRINTDRDEQYNAYTHKNYIGHVEQPNKIKFQALINRNRISTQRQAAIMTKPLNYGPFSPLISVLSTFTLMDLLNKQYKIRTAQKYLICSRVVQLYADKLSRADFNNLIPEEIEIYNFSAQSPAQLQVRVIQLNRSDRFEANEANMLYNMGFILDSLLNQVEAVDAYRANALQFNIPDQIELVLGKSSKQQKQKILIELARSIQGEYLSA